MTFIDRVPMYPGRIRLIPVPGQENTFDMVRADEPLIEGTPLNKALFDGIDAEMTALRHFVSATVFSLSQRAILENVAAGTEIGLYENGVLVPFIVASKTFMGLNKALVVRKHIYKMDTLLDEGEYIYADCKTDRWLNNEYISLLDPATQSTLTDAPFEVATANGSLATIRRKIFLLSSIEYTGSRTVGQYEGDFLSYFSSANKRIATFNGEPARYYTRSVNYAANANDADIISAMGVRESVPNAAEELAGIRPAFTLLLDTEVTVGVPSTENVMATAEV